MLWQTTEPPSSSFNMFQQQTTGTSPCWALAHPMQSSPSSPASALSQLAEWTTPMSESPAKDFQQVGSLAIAVNPGQVGRHFKAAAKKEPA